MEMAKNTQEKRLCGPIARANLHQASRLVAEYYTVNKRRVTKEKDVRKNASCIMADEIYILQCIL